MSAIVFMCIIIGVVSAINENWDIVFLCLLLGSCAG